MTTDELVHDPVHPKHYKQHPSGVHCIDVIEHMPLNIGTALKCLWRQGEKPGEPALVDIKKAIWYVERELARKRDGDKVWIPDALKGKREQIALHFPHWIAMAFNGLWIASFYDTHDEDGSYLEELEKALHYIRQGAEAIEKASQSA